MDPIMRGQNGAGLPRKYYDWEKNGVVNNVVYITGAAFNNGLHLFGGAADKVCFQTGPFQLEEIVQQCEKI